MSPGVLDGEGVRIQIKVIASSSYTNFSLSNSRATSKDENSISD